MRSDRVATGIPGLDAMCAGGFPLPSTTLVAGEPGTGKTTLSVQSLFHGARRGERGLYITAISEPQWVVQKFLSSFSFYDHDMLENGALTFVDISPTIKKGAGETLDAIKGLVEIHEPRRIVIDPITPFTTMMGGETAGREFMHDLFSLFKVWNASSLVTAEMSYDRIPGSLEGYMVDSVIVLSYPEEERVRRKYLEILKMRGTKHLTGKQLLDISEEGLVVQVGLR